ncbi:MAG TPA: hypothetical protein GYA07_00415 [Verrucomicrobia bacterium]|nr:hypothetical protein [Verrucomicrobiota bacterium]HOB33526.1 hypothetical protein [Verrucomicrobiota bacterium]HOP97791.1 hypothetical protein [Verrucomicrobiota bacterium]HPU56041.1 hypothetical protein [Verrucomicrobiota bacterium]
MNEDLIAYALISACFGIVFLLWFLVAMFNREAVKRELQQRCCEPIHIRCLMGPPFGPRLVRWIRDELREFV